MAHHLRCDGKRVSAKLWGVPCSSPAVYWHPESGLCFCQAHKPTSAGVEPISNMP